MRRVGTAQRPPTKGERIAARYFAEANRSDPFAYSRCLAHLVAGIEQSAQIIADYNKRAPAAPAAIAA